MKVLTDEVIASSRMPPEVDRTKRRAVQAQVTSDYLEGARNRSAVLRVVSPTSLGLNELRTGITCQGNFSARGNHKRK